MLNTIEAGKVDCFILETNRETRFEAYGHEQVSEFLKNSRPQGVIYFTRILNDSGIKEEQIGYHPETTIGQRVWKYTCKCGETEWRTVERKEWIDHFLCSFCDND